MQRSSFSIYDASAGSGKTYALVKEYLKIILTAAADDAYRNILAITFTNKAVHEMKGRIVGNLSEFSKPDTSPKALGLLEHLSRETGLSIDTLKAKSVRIIRHIIHNYAAFDISTIDKFTHRVIRAFAHDLNLPMTFEVTLDTENLLAEAVDALIAQAGEDETLTRLLVDFTMEKTDNDKSWDVSREILETGRLILNENNREQLSHFRNKSIDEFTSIRKKLEAAVQKLDEECVNCARELFALIEKHNIETGSFSAGHFPNHLSYILKGELKPTHKKYHEPADVRINKTAKDRAIIEMVLPELLSVLSCVYQNYEKKQFYTAFLKNITPLSLLNTVSNELAKIQSEQNVLSIAEFNAIIHNEIQNQPAPFIYERLGERYRHFFIDEFQDTSQMQWENLIPLINNATSSELNGEKGTLMIVGDPKQSIYRWRGGKAEQFIALSKGTHPFNNPDMDLVHLDRNYRSYSEVVGFNNRFFKFLADEFENPDYKDLYENRSHQLPNEKTGGYVNLCFLPQTDTAADDESEPDDKTAQYLKATIAAIENAVAAGFEYRDIAILTRKRDQGIALAAHLTEAQIPLLSSETLMIGNATEVRFVIHMLTYLKNSLDLESKAMLLHYLATQQTALPLHDFIAAGMGRATEPEFESWLRHQGVTLSFSALRKKSLYETVELIVSRLVTDKANNAYLQYFLDIVLERDLRAQAGISDFLSYWDKNSGKFSIPSPEGSNAVRIMTIHKSKGLEFPVVIMPFAEEDYNRKPKDKLWLDAEEEIIGLPKVLIDNSSMVENFGVEASKAYQVKKQEELLDNINVLYVALTRAEEQLYIISAMNLDKDKMPKKNNMAAFFLNFLEAESVFDVNRLVYEFGNRARVSESVEFESATATIPVVADILDPGSIKIAQKEALMWGTHQQEAIAYGNVVHEILSFVRIKSDIETALAKATENGLISADQKDTVRQTILEIVEHPELQPYFSAANRVLNEQAIIRKNATLVKPDRMVMTSGNDVLLLDYKTGTYYPKYRDQLENYEAAIEEMGYSVIKKALVFIGEQINIVNLHQ